MATTPLNWSLRTGKPAPDPTRWRSATLYLDHYGVRHQTAGNSVSVAVDPTDVMRIAPQGIPAQGQYIPMPAFGSRLNYQPITDFAN